MSDPILHVGPTTPDTIHDLAQWLCQEAELAIRDRGRFLLALSGGSTPRQLYTLLAEPSWQQRLDWAHTLVFFSDERDVPPTHPDSNFKMASDALLSHLNPVPQAIYRWHTEYSPAMALADYRHHLTLDNTLPVPPTLDVVLLGVGPEGHTASLFPDRPVLDSEDIVSHTYVPTHNSWRYTFTLPLLNASRHIAFLVTGSEKQEIIDQIFTHQAPVPASMIHPVPGDVHWFLDSASAQRLNPNILPS
ncbi:MAG: 6-phosphogluconolactonase [Sulfobacillus thermotolerans]|uniref:6-phosphogluconolactonase n=1 Tax=Sulfobacillus thermotolerans TaxID=338644 RepID=A0ABM6RS41_9FIRM|nr:6-phosphogluconolactonase [Sulfobacillus thermotolerans]MCY0908906.1 6-phosphogluconolactonase [Sulfobacillus thermotolerans]